MIVVYGDELTVEDDVILDKIEFERYLCNGEGENVKVKREPNKGESVFYEALAKAKVGAHGGLASTPESVFKKAARRTFFQGSPVVT